MPVRALWPAAALGLLWLGAGAVAPQCEAAPAGVPSLDELAGEWMPATVQRDTPAISNWAGSVGTNVDVVDATSFIVPPFAGGEQINRPLRRRLPGGLSSSVTESVHPPDKTHPHPQRPPCFGCGWTART